MKRCIVLMIIVVIFIGFQAQAATISNTELAALKAKVAALEAYKTDNEAYKAQLQIQITEIKKAIAKISDNAARDIEDRNRLFNSIGDNILAVNKKVELAEKTILALGQKSNDYNLALQESKTKQDQLASRIDSIGKKVNASAQVAQAGKSKNYKVLLPYDPTKDPFEKGTRSEEVRSQELRNTAILSVLRNLQPEKIRTQHGVRSRSGTPNYSSEFYTRTNRDRRSHD